MALTPAQFVAKWRLNRRNERGAYQEHFLDLCALTGQETPNQDPTGETYAFEKGAGKQDGGQGFADVWRRNCFAWEYKGKHADLSKAYQQLQQYRESLLNPPLLIASDIERIVIHSNFTNAVKRVYEIKLEDVEQDRWLTPLAEAKWTRPHATPVAMLRAIFADPESFRPAETIDAVTRAAAIKLGEVAQTLAGYGEDAHAAAHFLIRVLFCLFAEDVGLLPRNLFKKIIESSDYHAPVLQAKLRNLFRDMRDGGYYGDDRIVHFNGGLFDDENVLQLDGEAMRTLIGLSGMDWSSIDPSIFGTLFERSLDPAKRAQLGAHYTDRSDIDLIVEPVLMAPLREAWAQARDAGEPAVRAFHDQLAGTRVLDPACGSGNFLYVSLRALLDLEKSVLATCDAQGWARPDEPRVSPQNVYGIEINPYAHELAQATVWIGYLQ
ncbi:MAG: DNA methyltransferase, partial [Thermoflexales bacterium]